MVVIALPHHPVPRLGQLFTQNLAEFRHQHKTGEGSLEDDDSYLGYSVTTGEFNGDGDNADVAVGMPRGAGLTGKVCTRNYVREYSRKIFLHFNFISGYLII